MFQLRLPHVCRQRPCARLLRVVWLGQLLAYWMHEPPLYEGFNLTRMHAVDFIEMFVGFAALVFVCVIYVHVWLPPPVCVAGLRVICTCAGIFGLCEAVWTCGVNFIVCTRS